MAVVWSRSVRWLAVATACLCLVLPARALGPDDIEPTGPRNTDYEAALWGSGVSSEVTYLRPSSIFEPERTRIPEPEPDQPSIDAGSRTFWGIVFAVLLAVVVWIFLTHARGVGVGFRVTSDKPRARTGAGDKTSAIEATTDGPVDAFLRALEAMEDRREAIILLVGRLLESAAQDNKVRLGRAQTARDVVRVLPRDWRHLDALRRLVREAELVHFGGRDLPQDRWQTCLAAARPILSVGAPT